MTHQLVEVLKPIHQFYLNPLTISKQLIYKLNYRATYLQHLLLFLGL